jgi:hypothetical protein
LVLLWLWRHSANEAILHHNLLQQSSCLERDEILSQDIEEAVVMKAVKGKPTKQVATEEVKPKPRKVKTI